MQIVQLIFRFLDAILGHPSHIQTTFQKRYLTQIIPVVWIQCCDVWGGCEGIREARHAVLPPIPLSHGIQTSVLVFWFGNNYFLTLDTCV